MNYLCQKPRTAELAIDSLSTCIKAVFDWNTQSKEGGSTKANDLGHMVSQPIKRRKKIY